MAALQFNKSPANQSDGKAICGFLACMAGWLKSGKNKPPCCGCHLIFMRD